MSGWGEHKKNRFDSVGQQDSISFGQKQMTVKKKKILLLNYP